MQVVEAGNALFPDRAYVLTLPEPRKPALTTDDVTVTEDGNPVKNLAVLSSASANGLGTVLLIDSSNSMKGSIQAAMQAARAFAARNPGQPLSVVFFNATPKVALPLTTDPKQVRPRSPRRRPSPKARACGTRSPRRLRRCEARRSEPHGSSSSRTATTWAASLRSLDCRPFSAPGARHPRVHRRHRVVRLHGRRAPEPRGQDGRHVRGRRRRRSR